MHELSLKDRTLAALTGRRSRLGRGRSPPSRSSPRGDRRGSRLVAADVAAVVISLVVVSALSGARFTWWLAVLAPCYVLLTKMAGLYDRDQFVLHKTTLDETPALVAVSAIFVLVVEAVQGRRVHGPLAPAAAVGRLWSARSSPAGVRAVRRRAAARRRSACWWSATPSRDLLVERKLAADPSARRNRGRAVSVHPEARRAARPPARGRSTTCWPCWRSTASSGSSSRLLRRAARTWSTSSALATACGVRVAVLPRLLEVSASSVEFDDLGGQVMLGMRGFGLSPSSRVLKRVFDLVVAARPLLVLAPLLLADRARREARARRGPVLFRQTRVGPQRRRLRDPQVPDDGTATRSSASTSCSS